MEHAPRNTGRIPACGVFFVSVILALSAYVPWANAEIERKGYSYKDIYTTFEIRSDATVRVEERQTYLFENGSFHKGWRSIPLSGIDGITEITIRDASTGMLLDFSRKKMDKTIPENWGAYTTYKENGTQIIEWYYNLEENAFPVEKTWIIGYTVHGAIEFGTGYNRLYWNIFTDYPVSVDSASVNIVLPGSYTQEDTQGFFYRSSMQGSGELLYSPEVRGYRFTEQGFSSGEAFTVDVAWKKGIPAVSAYVKDFLKMNFGYVFSVLIVLGAGIFIGIHTHKEKAAEQRAIVPEYEPPQNMPPLFAELVLKERISPKGFSATIVDLAIRGYVKIIQDERGIFNRFLNILASRKNIVFLVMIILGVFFAVLIANMAEGIFKIFGFLLFEFVYIGALFMVIPAVLRAKKRSYSLELLKTIEGDSRLQDFEKAYLRELFRDGKLFSFEEIKKDVRRQREFSKKIQDIQNDVLKEMDSDTRAFTGGGIQKEKYLTITIAGAVFFSVFSWSFGSKMFDSNALWQSFIAIVSFISVSAIIWAFLKFEARLSEEGIGMKHALLGFKMFLGVTEKDRIKTITPDLFEKYLPYAMIFGVEKKWADTFEEMHLPQPEWVVMPHAIGAIDGTISSVFSPSAFSESFSSAFTSAIAGAGASGAAGGGGAGGGGGGGGGGAS